MNRLRVAVLMGGASAEREVSLMSGRKVLAALDPARYEAYAVDLTDLAQGRGAHLSRLLASPESGEAPEVVFIALHGGAGENGTVQGMLELLGFPYTGSGVLASALAMNKVFSKKLFEQARLPTPRWIEVGVGERAAAPGRITSALGLPCVVKPACEGSTIGLTIVRDEAELPDALSLAFRYGDQVVVEEFISGIEITGPVLGNGDPQVLPLVEIVPSSGVYDYAAKYTPGATEELIPARISEPQAQRARELALAAHCALGCRSVSRVDMIVTPDEVYVLEVNTIPGMTDTSLVPRAAEAVGLSFPALVDRLLQLAQEGDADAG